MAIATLLALPILVVVAKVGADSGGWWTHLASTVLGTYVRNTLWLALGVSLLTCVLGISSAWAVSLCEFPGRNTFRWALLLPLAIPTYLSAYAYADLLQFSGPVQSWLREVFEWGRQDYWFPQVRSLPGAAVILSLGLYPYVYLAARTAFLEQSVCVLEVGRTLGLGPWRSFFRIALPLARPSIIAGLSLVLMETLAEFGAVQHCAVDTFATGIYRAFNQPTTPSTHALNAAAQLSTCLLVLIALLLGLEVLARRGMRFHHMSTRYRTLPTWRLTGVRAAAAFMVCSVPVVLGFGVPLLLFATKSLRHGDARAREVFLEFGRNSFILAAVASALAVLLALLIAYWQRLHPSPLSHAMGRLAGIGYAIPGVVIAIGVLAVVDVGPSFWLSTTVIALIYGYQTRFLAVSMNFLQAGLTRIKPSIDGAARTLGASPGRMLRSVHFPLLRGTILAASLLVFVDVIKELPATLILAPFNFQTLAVRVYQLASDERLNEASSGALAMILIGLLPVAILSRMLDRSRPGDDPPAQNAPPEVA